MEAPPPGGLRLPRYRRLRRNSVIITSLVALIPLFILTFFNYLQDKEAFKGESRFTVLRILSNTKRTLEFVLEERGAALSLIMKERSYEELASNDALKTTLANLRESFGGFIDIGLIDSGGTQVHYVGPYDLKGKNYQDQDWFHEVLLREYYVSDVFVGYRGFPHFVMAFKKEKQTGDFYILRATLDMELLNQQIFSIDLDRETDAFIINQAGILQTASQFYGDVLDRVELDIPPSFRSREVVEEEKLNGKQVTMGYAFIKNSPFILVTIRKMASPLGHWVGHRSDVLWFLALNVIIILLVIFYFTTKLVKQLRDADLRRAKAFHNIEYTNKMATIGRMAAGVAHEINNPLAIINEKAGLLKDMATFDRNFQHKDKTVKLVDSILNSVDRCGKVTHRLLGFARRMDVRKELIDIRKLLEEVVGFQSTEVAHRNIHISYDFPDELPSVESDRGQLQQIFLNILNNAIAAVPDGGRIELAASRLNESGVRVTISDNGSGIEQENLKHIFEPFFSTKGEFGTGLGLSITHDLVENLGGTIDVESERGRGTVFTVTIPLKRPEIGG